MHRGRGIARKLLLFMLDDARDRGVQRVSLETGSMEFFAPARALYAKAGFVVCRPFGSYADDPHSTFMTLDLRRLSQREVVVLRAGASCRSRGRNAA